MTGFAGCESCRHYVYNEDYECYECLVNLDEDRLDQAMELLKKIAQERQVILFTCRPVG